MLPLERVSLPHHPEKVLARFGHQPCVRWFYRWSREKTPGSAGLPQCLDLHYEEDFLKKQSHQVPAVFSDLLFIPSMANAVYKAFKPPVVLKALPSTSSHKVPSISSQPEDGGPKPVMSELKESTPSTSKTSQQVQKRVTEASNTDSDKTDVPTPEKEQPP